MSQNYPLGNNCVHVKYLLSHLMWPSFSRQIKRTSFKAKQGYSAHTSDPVLQIGSAILEWLRKTCFEFLDHSAWEERMNNKWGNKKLWKYYREPNSCTQDWYVIYSWLQGYRLFEDEILSYKGPMPRSYDDSANWEMSRPHWRWGPGVEDSLFRKNITYVFTIHKCMQKVTKGCYFKHQATSCRV